MNKNYCLKTYVNGTLEIETNGTKRNCVNILLNFGVPYKNFLGIQRKPDKFAKKRAEYVLGWSKYHKTIKHKHEEILVIEFELYTLDKKSGELINKQYFLCPFISLGKIMESGRIETRVIKNLLKDKYCYIPYYLVVKSEDLLLGNFPIKRYSDIIPNIKLFDDSFDEFKWYNFIYYNECIFHKYA